MKARKTVSPKGRKAPPAAAGASTPAPPFVGRLNTVSGIRREICRLYREARTGKLAAADASRLGNLLFLAGRLVQGQELEARVAALEGRKR